MDPGSEPRAGIAPVVLKRLTDIVLLAGSVKPTRFTQGIGCHRLNLPLAGGRTLMRHWLDELEALRAEEARHRPRLRVVVDAQTNIDAVALDAGTPARVIQDPKDFRGTAGVLRDLCADGDPDDRILVATAAQFALEPVAELAGLLSEKQADVALLGHRDGTPCGLALMRRGVLESIARVGFVDFKEQALPVLAASHDVRVVQREHAALLPIRTLSEYLQVLGADHARANDSTQAQNAFREDGGAGFAVIANDVQVDPTARCHDAAVLPGARIEAGAIVVRSVVGCGAVVRSGQRVIDRLVSAAGGRP